MVTRAVSEYDFFSCWHQLTAAQKNALYGIAQIFAASNPEDAVEQERWQMIMEAKEDRDSGGKAYSQEEVKAMIQNRRKRDEL